MQELNRTRQIMIAVLDNSYYEANGLYPENFDSELPHERYVFESPDEFIKKWYEIDEGSWYWVFVDGEELCSGAVDPDDIKYLKESLYVG